jgi:ribokinase
MPEKTWITVMGSFVADCAFRTKVLPAWGQTILGSSFRLGPGGKGSNQAVAAARLGAKVSFIGKLGHDTFGDLARATYKTEGIDTRFLYETRDFPTGAASIVVDEAKGENAIVVVPGSGYQLTAAEVEKARPLIADSEIFVTQLEVPLAAVEHALQMAHELGAATILNPAPALALPDSIYELCDYLTPNESEAAELIGKPVRNIGEAERAAGALLARGARNVVLTLGAQGALVKNSQIRAHVPAVDAGPVIETTGAGDAFNGGFAVGIAEGLDIVAAAHLGCVVAGISVTRHGTADSMPTRAEVTKFLNPTVL